MYINKLNLLSIYFSWCLVFQTLFQSVSNGVWFSFQWFGFLIAGKDHQIGTSCSSRELGIAQWIWHWICGSLAPHKEDAIPTWSQMLSPKILKFCLQSRLVLFLKGTNYMEHLQFDRWLKRPLKILQHLDTFGNNRN